MYVCVTFRGRRETKISEDSQQSLSPLEGLVGGAETLDLRREEAFPGFLPS